MFKKSAAPKTSKNGKPKIIDTTAIFKCQLAHGSPTAWVTGFLNVKELYSRIAKEFDLKKSEILFCTLNTHKVDVRRILTNQMGFDDFIFAHIKGTPKEITLTKESNSLGITVVDNGAGLTIVKRIIEDSIASKMDAIQVGDHIEKINGIPMNGKKHHEVVQVLKNIPMGSTFTMRLIEPLGSEYSKIEPRQGPRSRPISIDSNDMSKGKKTVRFKYNGAVEVNEEDDKLVVAVEKINEVLESYYGINDSMLATQIWELSHEKKNCTEFEDAINYSDLDNLFLTDDLLLEMWEVITNVRASSS